MRIGSNTKPKPNEWIDGPPRTAVSATAPDGGCTHRSVNIAQIAKAIASAAASTGSAIQVAQATPTVADTRFPPIIDQGCASGLAGTAKSSTAEAPIGATSNGMLADDPSIRCIVPPVKPIPISAPRQERRRSGHLTATDDGAKLTSQPTSEVRLKFTQAEVQAKGPTLGATASAGK